MICLESLGGLYGRAGLPEVAAEIASLAAQRRSPRAGPDAQLSRYLATFDVEDTKMGWLTGLLLGYPLWSTIARYHAGTFTPVRRDEAPAGSGAPDAPPVTGGQYKPSDFDCYGAA